MSILSPQQTKINTEPHEIDITPRDFTEELNKSSWSHQRIWAGKMSVKLSQLGAEYKKRAERMACCSDHLGVRYCPDCGHYHVERAALCRDRACPICGALRARRLAAKVEQATQKAGGRYLFLTLTVPNIPSGGLKAAMKNLSAAFTRLWKMKRLKGLIGGYVRVIEITRNQKTDEWHPHIHALLRVEDSYFRSALYISQTEWLALWNAACQRDDIKILDIRAADETSVYEVCKYTTKGTDLEGYKLEELREWLQAVHGARLWSAGGCLRVSEKDVEIESDVIEEKPADDEKLCEMCGSHTQYVDLEDSSLGVFKRLAYRWRWSIGAPAKKKNRRTPQNKSVGVKAR